MMNPHADVRHRFLQHGATIESQQRDFYEWHQGRMPYVIWAIDVDTPEIAAQVFAAAQHLKDFLRGDYIRQPHITLSVCGFPASHLAASNLQADDFTRQSLEAQILNLKQLHLKPFEITVAALASFSLAPFFHVTASNRPSFENPLNAINIALNAALSSQLHPRTSYIPHITVGLYSGNWFAPVVSQQLDSFPKPLNINFLVSRISLMCYAPAVIGGTLQTIADYDLQSGEMTWHESLFS